MSIFVFVAIVFVVVSFAIMLWDVDLGHIAAGILACLIGFVLICSIAPVGKSSFEDAEGNVIVNNDDILVLSRFPVQTTKNFKALTNKVWVKKQMGHNVFGAEVYTGYSIFFKELTDEEKLRENIDSKK